MCKIIVCKCTQCKASKNKRGNRKLKSKIKRMLNKKRRKYLEDKIFIYYWA